MNPLRKIKNRLCTQADPVDDDATGYTVGLSGHYDPRPEYTCRSCGRTAPHMEFINHRDGCNNV